jgi:hypothetical protein
VYKRQALFWAMTLPAGAAIAELRKPNTYLISSVVCSIVLAISLWIYPHYSIGSSLAEAGRQLKEKNYEHYSIIGAYGAVINILQHRNGLCLDSLNKYFYDYPMPHNNELIKTNKSELLIAHHKKTPLRKLVSNIGIKGLEIQNYNPGQIISEGTVYEVLDNDAVTIYKWVK